MFRPENFKLLRLSGTCGILAPIVAFACILFAVASYSQFSWLGNALSDLGVVSGVTELVFNFGLVVSGILCIVFAMGLIASLGDRVLGLVGGFIFLLACMALVGIGVFPESTGQVHLFVSVMFFAFLPLSLLVIVAAFWRQGKTRMAVFTFITAAVAAAPWVLQFSIRYVSGVAIPETISALAGSAWAIVLGYMMFKEASRPRK